VRSTLDEFTKELGELETLVASITPVNEALAEHKNSLVRKYVSVRRRFDYAAFAVALYAYAAFRARSFTPGDPIHIFRNPDAPDYS